MNSRPLAVVASLALLLLLSPPAAAATMLGSSTIGPAPEELTPNRIAFVSNVPVRRGTITRAELHHELVLTSAAAGLRSAPKPGTKKYERFKKRAVNSLLEAVWIYGEATEMDISVTPSDIARELALIKKQNFKSGTEYQRFLRKRRFTRRDVKERVELQLLSMRIAGRIAGRIERRSRNKFEEKQAFKEYLAEYSAKWRSRTICGPSYATHRCSNQPMPNS